MGSQTVNAGLAFIFWVIAAHLFTSTEVGQGAAIVSFSALVANFSNLGLPSTLLRFLPLSSSRGGFYSACVLLALLTGTLGGGISLLFIEHVSPNLSLVRSSWLIGMIVILLVVGNTVNPLLDVGIMAFRRGDLILVEAILANTAKIVAILAFSPLGLDAIILAFLVMWYIGIAFDLIVTITVLMRNEKFRPRPKLILEQKRYAAANYFGGMMGVLPATLLPLIVLGRLSASEAAYFYMPLQIATFLNVVCGAVSQSLLSESSHTEDVSLQKNLLGNAVKHLYRVLIPTAVLLGTGGWLILRVYGATYAHQGYPVLVCLCAASPFVAINWMGDTWLNVRRRAIAYFTMNSFNALVVVTSCYIASSHGLFAIGIGWLTGQAMSAGVYLLIFGRDGIFQILIPGTRVTASAHNSVAP